MTRDDEDEAAFAAAPIEAALLEAALEERIGGLAAPDLAAAVMEAAERRSAHRRASGWWWVAAAAVLLGCGAVLGSWWSGRGGASGADVEGAPGGVDAAPASGPDGVGPGVQDASSADGADGFYVPRDAADALAVLRRVDSPDVQFHFVGPYRLPTASVSGPPAPTLALGRWGLGKAIALGLARALEAPRLVSGIDAGARPHTIFVHAANDRRMRLALFDGVLWVDGLGTFATDFECGQRLRELELQTRRQLGLVHRDELRDGLPNELIADDQRRLRPFGLSPEDVVKLAGLPGLEHLDLRWCDAAPTEPFARALRALPAVRELWLRELGDGVVRELAPLPLRELVVVDRDEAPWRAPLRASCAAVTDAGLAALARLRDLQVLVLPGCRASRAGLAGLAACKQLRALVLTGAQASGATAVWRAFAAHPALEELRLSDSNLARVQDLGDLAAVPGLQELDLAASSAGDVVLRSPPEVAAEMLRRGPERPGFGVDGHAALAALATFPRLRRLSLGGWFRAAITVEDRSVLAAMASAPPLRWLSLPDCPGLGVDDLLALGAAKQLETIVLAGTAGEATGLVPLSALSPLLDAIPGLTVITE